MSQTNNNDFLNLVKDRYSVRSFSNKQINENDVNKILLAAKYALTACNRQPQVIYTIRSKEGLDKLNKCKYQHFGETLAFLICYDTNLCWVRDFDNKPSGEIDASIVATHMILEASNLGIDSTWIMHYIPQAIRKEFNLPDNIIDVALLVMGYKTQDSKPSSMHYASKEIEEFNHNI